MMKIFLFWVRFHENYIKHKYAINIIVNAYKPTKRNSFYDLTTLKTKSEIGKEKGENRILQQVLLAVANHNGGNQCFKTTI